MNKTYPYEQVFDATLNYFDGDTLAATTWIEKYAVRDNAGNYIELTPEDMHKRMAREFSRIEQNYNKNYSGNTKDLSAYGKIREDLNYDKIKVLLDRFRYIVPQGSVMAVLGNPFKLASLSNCVVMPSPYDSYGGIFQTDQQLAQLYKRRCGVGIDISTLRPKNARVSNSAGTTSGAVSFMERFSNTTREVAQNGRRGALMITMDVSHPDIDEFISIKQDLTKVTAANISVRLSDDFMRAVLSGANYTHHWPIDAEQPAISKNRDALELWKEIVRCAHQTAEPGLLFWDRQHEYSTSSVYPEFRNISTNPCSEIAMQGGDSCRLIAMNLYSFVKDPFTPKARFDYKYFYQLCYEAQRLMDDLVDLEIEAIDRILEKVSNDPEPEKIKQVEIDTWELLKTSGKHGRRTGLGFTALADTIAALGLKYDSDEALHSIEQIMRMKCSAEFDSSIDMAIERGKFIGFNPKIEKTSLFVQMMEKEFPEIHARMMQFGRRNISISTVAPTGSLSLLTQTSSGIEPVFMLKYTRRRRITAGNSEEQVDFIDQSGDKWQEFEVNHPKLNTWMEITSQHNIQESPYFGATANEISWQRRIEIQAIIQKYVTHSISSTINLPEDISPDEVSEIYLKSWQNGLKGITVYREGARSGVLIRSDNKENYEKSSWSQNPVKRPESLSADVIRFRNNDEQWIAVIGFMNGEPYEIFTGRADASFALPKGIDSGFVIKKVLPGGKKQYDFAYKNHKGELMTVEGLSRSFDKEYWNYAKLISGVLRHGMPLPYVVDLVLNLDVSQDNINSWKNGVARALSRYISTGTGAVDKECPECHDPQGLYYQEGCLKCKSCGMMQCG